MHPYTQALLASVLTPDPALGVPDVGLGDAYPDPTNIPPGCRFHPRCPKGILAMPDNGPEQHPQGRPPRRVSAGGCELGQIHPMPVVVAFFSDRRSNAYFQLER